MGITSAPSASRDLSIAVVPVRLTQAELDAMAARRRDARLKSKKRLNQARARLGFGPIEALQPGIQFAYAIR